jgi:hypothetical protein
VRAPRASPPAGLHEQPRLADPGLARDQARPPSSAREKPESAVHRGQLPLPTNPHPYVTH